MMCLDKLWLSLLMLIGQASMIVTWCGGNAYCEWSIPQHPADLLVGVMAAFWHLDFVLYWPLRN
jgi:hypothetical protein